MPASNSLVLATTDFINGLLRDILGILKISGQGIDVEYIAKWAKTLDLEEVWRKFSERE